MQIFSSSLLLKQPQQSPNEFSSPSKRKRKASSDSFKSSPSASGLRLITGLSNFLIRFTSLVEIEVAPSFIDGGGIGCHIEGFCLWKDKRCPLARKNGDETLSPDPSYHFLKKVDPT